MKIPVPRSCMTLIVLSALVEATRSNENDTSTVENRKSRANGRIVKQYSGYKPNPIVCTEEGFKADPIQCTVFYRCLKSYSGKFTVFKFQCAPGTVYDPENEVCNHPSSTRRRECGGIISTVEKDNDNEIVQHELPSPISTNSPVYMNAKVPVPNNSDVYTLATEKGYTFSYTTLTPYPVITDIKNPTYTNQNLVAYPETSYKNSTGQIFTSSSTSESSVLDRSHRCTSDGFMGDSDDCKKFYRCVSNSHGGFIRYEFMCSDPTVWDDQMQSCNHPWAVRSSRCDRGRLNNKNFLLGNTNVSTIHGDVNYGVTPSLAPNQNINQNIETPPKASVPSYGDRLHNVNIGSSLENTYINYKPQLSTLPVNNKNTATEASLYTKDSNVLSLKTTTNAVHSTITLLETNIKNSTVLRANTICTQSGFIGDSKDCKKFYRCVDNGKGSYTTYEFSCSAGTVWDKEVEACNYAWAVKECGGTSTAINLSTLGIRPSTSTSSTTAFNENIYSGYFNQEKELPTTVTVSTTVSLISTTTTSHIIGMGCTKTGFIGDKNDCSKFYRCVDNGNGIFKRYEYKCGDGTLWDQNIEACNHAWAVEECGSKNNSENYTSNSNIYYSTNNYDFGSITTISPSSSLTSKPQNEISDYDFSYALQDNVTSKKPTTVLQPTTSKQNPEKGNNCYFSGFIGDIYNCNKFYRCVDNGNGSFVQYEFICGEGTVWDPEIEACNHAWAVKDCGSNISNENISTSSTTNLNLEESIIGQVTQSYNNTENTTPYITTTKRSISAANKNNECKTDGFMGDENDCRKFYRCVDSGNGSYIRYDFSCGEGTLWDPQINSCNHAWAVKDCKRISTETANTLPIGSSVTPENGVNNEEHTTQSNKDLNSILESSTLLSSTTTMMTVANENNVCKSDGFIGDNNDCQKFYRCVENGSGGFLKYEFMCGDGTVWDSKIGACNHKWAVEKCGGITSHEFVESTTPSLAAISPVTQLITTTTVFPSSTPYSTTINTSPSHHDTDIESLECKSEGFYGNPNDCKKFYRCVNDGKGTFTKYEFSCADGTIWIQEIQACDFDMDTSKCNVSSGYTTTTTTSTDSKIPNSTEITHSTNAPNLVNTTDETIVDKDSNNKCTSEGFYPHKENCQYFYRCVDNGDGNFTKYEFSCAEGTAWDINIQSCNYINDVEGCNVSQNSDNVMDNNTIPDKQSTESYATKTTTLLSVSTTTKPATQDTCIQEGYFGNSDNCKKFYRCVHNPNGGYTKYDYTCGEGTIWDQDIIACNHPYDVKNPSCTPKQENTSPTSTSSTLTTHSNTTLLITTEKPSTISESPENKNNTNLNCNNNSSTEVPPSNSFNCTKAGFFADLNNCKKFYRCVDWENNGQKFSLYHFECADGTIWDPALETCNYEESVYPPRNCNSTQQSNENITEISTEIPVTTNQVESTTFEATKITQQTTMTTAQLETTSTTKRPTTLSSTTEDFTTKPTIDDVTTKSTTQALTTEELTTKPPSTTETTTQSSTTKEFTTIYTTSATAQSTMETIPEHVITEASTTEPSEEQTTKLSTAQTVNQETTIKDSSTTVTQLTTFTTDRTTTTEQITTEQSIMTDSSSQTTNSQFTTDETSSSSTTENNQEMSTETNPASNKECPDTDNDQSLFVCPTSFKRHPKYCNLFYQCTEDNESHELKIAVFSCPNNTIYDESKVQCVEDKKSNKKCSGQKVQKYRVKRLGAIHSEPFVATKDSMACQNIGHFPFEKYTKCSSTLLKCELTKSGKLKGYVYRCPEGFIYWTISRRCEAVRSVRDCKHSSYPWNKRYDIPIERFNVAP